MAAPKPLAALEVGFHTRLLRGLQESVWASHLGDVKDVEGCLSVIERNLKTLGAGLSGFHYEQFLDLKARIIDRHDAAAAHQGRLLRASGERVAKAGRHGSPDEPSRALIVWQEQDWQELRLLTRQAVEQDARLAALWDIGFAQADVIDRGCQNRLTVPLTDAEWDAIYEGIEALPAPERAWVEEIMPADYRDVADLVSQMWDAYETMRDYLPRCDKLPDTRAEFEHSADFRICKWWGKVFSFNRSQARMVKCLYESLVRGEVGVPVSQLFTTADLRRDDQRLEHVFRNKREGDWEPHPAWAEGLIQHVGGKVYRLNLQEPQQNPGLDT